MHNRRKCRSWGLKRAKGSAGLCMSGCLARVCPVLPLVRLFVVQGWAVVLGLARCLRVDGSDIVECADALHRCDAVRHPQYEIQNLLQSVNKRWSFTKGGLLNMERV